MVMIDNEQPHQELVKCVVVGDTAVGKTRLICARACNKRVLLTQLLNTHVPTVWAIDQYRMCKDVLERSWEEVDGVNVSLRLWDTFGDHEKDRRFAYGRSDVVILCFSLSNRISLRNCKAMWFPEIRQFCPQTPVLLVGCKNDLRFMYRDETYQRFFRDKSPFIRPVRKNDLVMPDEARVVAREFGIHYYETSVLTYYGVNEVFENAIRAALISRRRQRFWMTNLKKVQRPLLQSPYCPPKPMPPPVQIQSSIFEENISWLWKTKMNADVVLVAGNVAFFAHKFMLAAASSLFHSIFVDEAERIAILAPATSSSHSSLASTFGEAALAEFEGNTELLVDCENSPQSSFQSNEKSSDQVLPTSTEQPNAKTFIIKSDLRHAAYSSVLTEFGVTEDTLFDLNSRTMDEDEMGCDSSIRTTVTLSEKISPMAMTESLRFLYTCTIDPNFKSFQELKEVAQLLELNELSFYIDNFKGKDEFVNSELKQRVQMDFRDRLTKICVDDNAFTDIIFQLEDGAFAAHRALLSARCDVMRAMFSGNFKERSAKIVYFPGVQADTFHHLLMFLYTDNIEPISSTRCLDLIELANRLCLTRLINLVEKHVIEELSRFAATENADVIQPCLRLLETCKLHNADQLADWCMIYLCVNYNKLCKMSPKLLKNLHPENQDYLMEHRWPPVWYLKDSDYYTRRISEKQKEDKPIFKRGTSSSRCLCFGSNNSAKPSPVHSETPITVTWKIS
ncbi:hypothetical protein V9T40_014131 [Parthenolecanium corni]|uniref:BTB domain-containing protein n=1 Tax=Parthenolecanium corni TaxID=536013 RepID=A0AAN9Y3B1_9HEMI